MITEIKIEKLFNRFDYEILLKPGGVTIITGPNGFGKSTILRIINSLGNSNQGNITYLIKLDFKRMNIKFDNNKIVKIKKMQNSIVIDDVNLPIIQDSGVDFYREHRPWIRKTQTGLIDLRTGESFTDTDYYYHILFNDVSEGFDEIFDNKFSVSTKNIREKLEQISEWCGEVQFISDQRLIRKERRRMDDVQIIDVISELPNMLKKEISQVSEEYSHVANTLDSTYPKRLFAAREGLSSKTEYKRCLEEANKKFAKLNEYNLVNMSIIDDQNYKSKYSTALKIYFEDFAMKYSVFQELISKLDLFTKIINDRLTFKKIKINRDKGFEVIDIDDNSRIIKLEQLSSGEKQEIVLFYDLIFNTKSKLLLLLDEPEISLHITWQQKFLDDLLAVSKLIQLQAIVATHSPQIVSKHLDIQIDLGEIYGKKFNF